MTHKKKKVDKHSDFSGSPGTSVSGGGQTKKGTGFGTKTGGTAPARDPTVLFKTITEKLKDIKAKSAAAPKELPKTTTMAIGPGGLAAGAARKLSQPIIGKVADIVPVVAKNQVIPAVLERGLIRATERGLVTVFKDFVNFL